MPRPRVSAPDGGSTSGEEGPSGGRLVREPGNMPPRFRLPEGAAARRATIATTRALRRMTVASRSGRSLAHALACGLVAGCAGTTVTLTPSPQAPLCDRNAIALVFWAPQWRPDQKDVAQREAAADAGMRRFLAESG
ncbi:MAG: hypothetical protein JNK67_13185 [Alphaproteobacteria bacterium]|nr:hypothetical protein [Alphaproteobacteria bacterium]